MFFELINKTKNRKYKFPNLDNIDVKVYPQCCPGGSTERCKT
jgi:hypothetical protein